MTTKPRVSPSATILLFAMGVTGAAAAYQVSPVLWLLTAVVGLIVFRAGLRDGQLPGDHEVDIRELPSALRERVRSAFAQLPAGAARNLLLGVLNQARLVFARGDSRFDAAEESQLREHVAGLVDACCTTAADLGRLDQFANAPADAGAVRAELPARAGKAREAFRDPLTSAA